MAFPGKIAHRPTHNNETKSLTFTENLTFLKHKAPRRCGDLNLKL